MNETITKIKVLDRSYHIKCSPDEVETLKAAAKHLEENIIETQNKTQLSFVDALVLSTLNIYGTQLPSSSSSSAANVILSEQQLEEIQRLDLTVKSALEME